MRPRNVGLVISSSLRDASSRPAGGPGGRLPWLTICKRTGSPQGESDRERRAGGVSDRSEARSGWLRAPLRSLTPPARPSRRSAGQPQLAQQLEGAALALLAALRRLLVP